MADNIPDVGDTFTREGRQGAEHYRVTGWLRRRSPRNPDPDPQVEELMASLSEKFPRRGAGPDNVPLEFCLREQAEYVCGAGVCGVIMRVCDVRVDGRVPWPRDLLDGARRHAEVLAGEPLT
jgi:hypothetical protein